MGLDGFSLSNLGLNRNLTSAQMANEADATARQSLENQIADVDGIGKKEKVGKKDEDAAFNGMVPFIGEPKQEDEEETEENQEEEQQSNESQEDDVSDETDDEEADNLHFRINAENKIEIWDNETKQVIKTISPEEAANVIHNFAQAPGIFVNREI